MAVDKITEKADTKFQRGFTCMQSFEKFPFEGRLRIIRHDKKILQIVESFVSETAFLLMCSFGHVHAD